MRKIIFFLFCFYLALSASAQDNSLEDYVSEYTYIYRLKKEDVYAIHVKGKAKQIRPYLHSLIDSVKTKELKTYSFSIGHYLLVSAYKEELKIEEKVEQRIFPQLIRNGKDFQLLILDENGNNIHLAEVLLDGERIAFNSQRQYYFKSNIRKSSTLEITYGDNFICGSVNVSKDRKDLDFYVSKLVVFAKRVADKTKNGIVAGYLITSKPMYRPGDTVKVKAIAYKLNNHYHRKADLFLLSTKANTYRKDEVKIATLIPDEDGNFLFSFKLSDTLALDKDYTLLLKNRKLRIENDFLLKDYRLEDYTFKTYPHKNKYRGEDTVIFYFDAHDVFGNPLDGAKVRIKVSAQRLTVKESMPDYIPFSSVDSTLLLTAGKNNRFVIPQHLLPKLAGTFLVDLFFTDAQHHSKRETVEFSVEDNSNYFNVKREDSLFIIEHIQNNQSIASSVLLIFSEEQLSKKIDLPFKGYIHPYLIPEKVIYQDQSYSLQMPTREGPKFVYEKTEKAYQLTTVNPHHIPFSYELFRNKKRIAEGYGRDYSLDVKNSDQSIYTLKINYFSNGYEEKTTVFTPAVNNLTITTNLPASIRPGDTASVTITVRDRKNLPVKGLNITASALDAKFKAIHYPEFVPSLQRKVMPKTDMSLIADHRLMHSERTDAEWSRVFHRDTSLYYRFIHPHHNGFYHYIDNKDSVAEFAPHIVDGNYRNWVYYILLDGEPVYFNYFEYSSSQKNIVPFSFAANPGYHRISIRTTDKLLEVDSVLLVSGKKLIFSIDIALQNQSNCNILKVGARFSKSEIEKLKARKIYIRNHLRDAVMVDFGYTKAKVEKEGYFIVFNDQPLMIGCRGKLDTVEVKGKTNIDIHESGIFTVFDSKVKPVVYSGYSLNDYRTYSSSQQPQDLLRMVSYKPSYSYRELVPQPINYYDKQRTTTDRGTFFLNNYATQPLLSYSLLQPDSNLSFYNEIYPLIYDVKPGTYDLIVWYDSTHVSHQLVYMKPNEMTIIDAKKMVKDTDFVAQEKSTVDLLNLFEKINPQTYRSDDRYSYKYASSSSYQSSFTYSKHLRFNPGNRYLMIGGGLTMTQWDIDQSGGQAKQFISLEFFVANKLLPRITGELNLQYIHANQYQSSLHFSTKQLGLSSFVYIDLFENRGKYVKRADWTPFIKTGFAAFMSLDTYSSEGVKPSWFQPLIPLGVGLRYKFARHIDLSVSAVRQINLLGGSYNSMSLGSFNQLESSVIYIIPAKVICPKFRDGYGGRSYSVVTDDNYIFENDLQVNPSSEPVKVRTSFNDLAYWQPALKTDAQGQVTYNVKFPEDITVWKNYIIGVGKHKRSFTKVDYIAALLPLTIKLNTPRFLIAQDSFTVYSQLLNATQQLGFDVHCEIQSGKTVITKDTILVRKATVSATFKAGASDSTTVQGIVQSTTVGNDGEVHKIPVLYAGIMDAQGKAFSTLRDTSFTFRTDSIVGGKLIVNPSAIEEMVKDLENLNNYPYTCMEQTASKLRGLLLMKSIYKTRGQLFKGENDIHQLLKRLEDKQQADGSWGWWDEDSDLALTAYVTLVLKQADSMGYSGAKYKRSLAYLQRFEKDSAIKLNVLLTLSELNVSLDSNTLNAVQRLTPFSDMEAISCLRILQLNKRAYSIQKLLTMRKQNTFGGAYWGNETWNWTNNQVSATLLAYKILQQHGGYERELEDIRRYLYSSKENAQWRNTVETASIIDLLVRDMKPVSSHLKTELSVNQKTVALPYTETLQSNKSYTVSYTTDQPVFVSYYTEQWNHQPQKEGNHFKIATRFIKDGKTVEQLKAGEEYLMAVQVDVQRSASYVMVEVPLPAGCLTLDHYRKATNETHRENFMDKTNIYLAHVSAGSYTYYLPLKASYAGFYTLNPAKVSLMYFPALFGQEGLKKIRIVEK